MSAAMFSFSKYQAFFDQLTTSERRVLLLDYDGTIAPFVVERSAAFPYPEVPSLLSDISRSGTRVVIVTGRRAMEIPKLLGVAGVVEVWGCHGLERLWPDASFVGPEIPELTQAALDASAATLVLGGLSDCVEIKPGCVAVHWRGWPQDRQAELEATAYGSFAAFSGVAELEVLPFDQGVELRFKQACKGRVIERILAETPGNRAIAYLGDDLTDEDAFHALHGQGLSVLVRERYRDSAADVWIKSPAQLFAFLEHWIEATGGAR